VAERRRGAVTKADAGVRSHLRWFPTKAPNAGDKTVIGCDQIRVGKEGKQQKELASKGKGLTKAPKKKEGRKNNPNSCSGQTQNPLPLKAPRKQKEGEGGKVLVV